MDAQFGSSLRPAFVSQDLLGFSAGAGATGGLTDPWATSTQPSAGLTDPWGMQPAQSGPFSPPVAANDPWSPAATAAAPTYSNASSMSSNNPWDTPTQGGKCLSRLCDGPLLGYRTDSAPLKSI